MWIFIFTFISLVIVFITVCYVTFRIAYCYPKGKQRKIYNIPDSNSYHNHMEKMKGVAEELENLSREDIYINAVDGSQLYGRLYIFDEAKPLVIVFHGYHGIYAWDGYGIYKVCRELNYNMLFADMRAHGRSGGRIITYGIIERYDCRDWVKYAAERFGRNRDIYLSGVSMGAATVLLATELGLPENVKGIVSDCSYSEAKEIQKETIRMQGLPVGICCFFLSIGARLFGKLNIKETTPLQAVGKIKLPVLFIHGTKDSVVPLYMNELLYSNCTSPYKRRLLVEGADHANSALHDYEDYERSVRELLTGDYLNHGTDFQPTVERAESEQE